MGVVGPASSGSLGFNFNPTKPVPPVDNSRSALVVPAFKVLVSLP